MGNTFLAQTEQIHGYPGQIRAYLAKKCRKHQEKESREVSEI